MNGSVKVARIMLNVLGLYLEDSDKEELEIYDKENNIVGKLNNKKEITISANINGKILSANLLTFKHPAESYRIMPTRSGHRMMLTKSYLTSEYCFQFDLTDRNETTINGKFGIYPYSNPNNLRCACTALMIYTDASGKKIQFTSDGSIPFLVDIEDKDSFEKLQMSFNGHSNNGIIHRVESGGYDNKIHSYRLCNIFESADKPKYLEIKLMNRGLDEDSEKKSSHIYLKELHEIKEYKSRDFEYEDASDKEMIQQGKLAHKYDPSIDKCLEYLCNKVFMIGDVSLFKNLLSMCFDNYSDEMFEVLFNTERDRSFYQDGSISLTDAYFDLEKWENYAMSKRR